MVNSFRPMTLSEALDIRKNHDVMIFNGGSDLMVKYRSWSGISVDLPKDVLYIGHLNELKSIDILPSEIIIGAAVSYAQFLRDSRLPIEFKHPIEQIGSVAIRNIGTLVGNICNASPAGDTLPMLYALDAKVVIMSTKGQRVVDIADFITGPGSTQLNHDEIVTGIIIPRKMYDRTFYRKVGTRKANAISKVSVFAVADIKENQIDDIRICIGSCGPTVIRAKNIESFITDVGLPDLSLDVDQFLRMYDEKIVPIDDVRSTKIYRSKVACNLIKTFLTKEVIL